MEPQKTANPSSDRKILCIEDERFIGELYARALKKAGYKVTVVVDGIEGLKKAQTNDFDIILLDLMLPNMDGYEILKTLKDDKTTPNLKSKIIITTNLEQRYDIKSDIENQADGYVVKADLTPGQLVEFLNSIS